jgi:hypothetical protein
VRRHRDIAAAPRRRASETWQAITDLVVETLARSPHIDRADIVSAMSTAAAVGMPLVAGGHLDKHPLILVASPIDCTIGTVSGAAALSIEENLEPIAGGVQAQDFTLYLPTPEPLADVVQEVAARSPHLSADEPPAGGTAKASEELVKRAGLVDLEALARKRDGRP